MSTSRAVRALLIAGLAVAMLAPAAALGREDDVQIGRMDRPASPAASASDRLIVAYRAGTSREARGRIRAAEQLEHVRSMRSLEADVVRPVGRSLAAAIKSLERRPEVAAVVVDHRRSTSVEPTGEPAWPEQWALHNVGQAIPQGDPPVLVAGKSDADLDGLEALRFSSGTAGVIVAVIDSGVDFAHPDLASRAWSNPGESGLDSLGRAKSSNGVDDDDNGYVDDYRGWDFCNDDKSVHDVGQDWHGTAVAGTMAASLNGTGSVGIAPSARVMALKFLKDAGEDPQNPQCGWDDQAIEAIAYAKSFGVRIINASWGGAEYSALLETAVAESGALFVAAAGNNATNVDIFPNYPSSFPSSNILAVGAINNAGQLADFSNYGLTDVDLLAPGESVVAPVPLNEFEYNWYYVTGTSFSAPLTAGVAALVARANPSVATATGLRNKILASVAPLAAARGTTVSGGLLNARRALDFTAPKFSGVIRVTPLGGRTMSAGTFTVRLAWPAATDDLAMGSYRVELRRNGGAWEVLNYATTNLYRDATLSMGTTYDFRVIPRDAGGNVGAASPLATTRPVLREETYSSISYSSGWSAYGSSGASGGATKYTTVSGAAATYWFTGRAVALVMPMSTARGSVKVYVDDVYIRTVDLYAASATSQVVVFARSWDASGPHKVKLVNTHVSTRKRADLDAIVVLP